MLVVKKIELSVVSLFIYGCNIDNMNQNYPEYQFLTSRFTVNAGKYYTRHLTQAFCQVFMVVAACFVYLPAFAKPDDTPFLSIYTEVRYPADYIQTASGDELPSNSASELMHALVEKAGLPYSIKVVPWARAIQAIDNEPNVIVYSMARTPEREPLYHWIGEIRPINIYLFGLRERKAELPDTLQVARDFRIGNLLNDVVDEYFRGEGFPDLVYFRDFSRSISMLQRGRIDLIPFAEHGIEEFLIQQGVDTNILVPMVQIDAVSTSLNIVLSKSTDPDVTALLIDSYQELVESGRYEEIMGIEWRGDSGAR